MPVQSVSMTVRPPQREVNASGGGVGGGGAAAAAKVLKRKMQDRSRYRVR